MQHSPSPCIRTVKRFTFRPKDWTGLYRGVQRANYRDCVAGTYTCADGPNGTFTLSGLESHENAFGARIDSSHPSCGANTQEIAGFSLD